MFIVNGLSFNTAEQTADHIADFLDQVLSAFVEEEGYYTMKNAIRELILDNIATLRPGQSTMCIGHKVTRCKTEKEQA